MLPVFQAGQFGRGLPQAPAGDPYFSSVVLLMNLDSGYTDQSSYARTGTGYSSPAISTTTKKFGAGSGSFDQIKSYRFAYDTSLRFDGEYTVEMWAYFNVNNVSQSPIGRSFGQYLELKATGKLYWIMGSSITSASTVTAGVWHHIAITRDASNVMRMFIDGVLEGSQSSTTVWGDSGGTMDLTISGYPGSEGTPYGVSGFLDDIRLTKGVCRYSADFAVPTTAFPAF